MKVGAFSISLSVKDINASKSFYETLGFSVYAGSLEHNYFIMKNEDALVGLFQGMFEGNIITFNPGWNQNAEALPDYDDVRAIQKHLKDNGITLIKEAEESTSGPESITMTDPDGNVILIDQHV